MRPISQSKKEIHSPRIPAVGASGYKGCGKTRKAAPKHPQTHFTVAPSFAIVIETPSTLSTATKKPEPRRWG